MCGSCEASYGKSQVFDCEECFSGFVSALLILLSVFMLLGLAGFTVRSNLLSFVEASKTVLSAVPQVQDPSGSCSVAVDRLIPEARCVELTKAKIGQTSQPLTNTVERAARESELSKWKAVEMFKANLRPFNCFTVSMCSRSQ